MYINFNTFKKHNLQPQDLYYLLAVKQIEKEQLPQDVIERFEALGILTTIKGKKSDSEVSKIRLNDKGKNLISELEEAPIEEQDTKVGDWLINHYKQIGKQVGNSKRLMRHIRDFRIKSGIEKNNLIRVCLDFISDEDNMLYNNVLEFAFYKPLTAFQTRFQLEDSRLYRHYIKHKERLDSGFEN